MLIQFLLSFLVGTAPLFLFLSQQTDKPNNVLMSWFDFCCYGVSLLITSGYHGYDWQYKQYNIHCWRNNILWCQYVA